MQASEPSTPSDHAIVTKGEATGARIATFVIGALLLVVVAVLALIASAFGFAAARPPNPFVSDDLLCCAYPDTWGQVVKLSVGAVVFVAGAAAVAVVAAAFLLRSIAVRDLPGIASGWVAGLAVVATVVAIVVGVAPAADEAVTAPDCDTFAFDRRAWDARAERRSEVYGGPVSTEVGEADRRAQRQMLGVASCRVIHDGMTRTQVRAALGRPVESATGSIWAYGPLWAEFDSSGRLVGVRITKPARFDW